MTAALALVFLAAGTVQAKRPSWEEPELVLIKPTLTDESALAEVKAAPWAKRLVIRSSGITDKGLKAIAAAGGFKELALLGLNATDEGVAAAASVGGLERLELDSLRRVTERGIGAALANPSLKSLRLGGPTANDGSLAQVKAARSLVRLELTGGLSSGETVSAKGIESLKDAPSLASLHLSLRVMTDRDLSAVASLRNLKELALGFMPSITDEGLASLRGHSFLRGLELQGMGGLTPAVTSLLGSMSSLEALRLYEIKAVSDANLAALRGLRSLKLLSITRGPPERRG